MATSEWRIRTRFNPIRWMICAVLGHNYEWRRVPGNCSTALCAVCERLEVRDVGGRGSRISTDTSLSRGVQSASSPCDDQTPGRPPYTIPRPTNNISSAAPHA